MANKFVSFVLLALTLLLLDQAHASPLDDIQTSLRLLKKVVPLDLVGEKENDFSTMTFVTCDQGSQCYNEAMACSNKLKGPSQTLASSQCSSSDFSSANTQQARDAYCNGQCYKTAFGLIAALYSQECKQFFNDAGILGNLFLVSYTTITSALEYTCTQNPNSATPQYCSVMLSTPPFSTLTDASFIGGANSTGCGALLGLGCCWQSTLNFLNASGTLVQFGSSSQFAQYTYSTICQLSGVPACPIPGISTTYVQGTLAIRNLNIAYITAATSAFVKRVIARVIYDSIVAQNPNYHITPASIVVTDINDAGTTLSRNFHTMSSNGVLANFYVQSSVSSENSNLATTTQQALQNAVTTAFNQLPSASKYSSSSSVAVNPSSSSASATTTQDYSAAFSVVPSALSFAVALLALIAVTYFA